MTAKEARFIWSPQHERAFQEVRDFVVRHPVLKYYDLQEEVTVQCDASEYGLGAGLLQNGQPVAFASRSLSQTERQYAQIEKDRFPNVPVPFYISVLTALNRSKRFQKRRCSRHTRYTLGSKTENALAADVFQQKELFSLYCIIC